MEFCVGDILSVHACACFVRVGRCCLGCILESFWEPGGVTILTLGIQESSLRSVALQLGLCWLGRAPGESLAEGCAQMCFSGGQPPSRTLLGDPEDRKDRGKTGKTRREHMEGRHYLTRRYPATQRRRIHVYV